MQNMCLRKDSSHHEKQGKAQGEWLVSGPHPGTVRNDGQQANSSSAGCRTRTCLRACCPQSWDRLSRAALAAITPPRDSETGTAGRMEDGLRPTVRMAPWSRVELMYAFEACAGCYMLTANSKTNPGSCDPSGSSCGVLGPKPQAGQVQAGLTWGPHKDPTPDGGWAAPEARNDPDQQPQGAEFCHRPQRATWVPPRGQVMHLIILWFSLLWHVPCACNPPAASTGTPPPPIELAQASARPPSPNVTLCLDPSVPSW